MKKYLALFLLIFQCFCVQNAQAWNQELVDAVAAIDSGSATPRQQALVVQHNVTINQMRIKGLISDQAYQRSQLHYAEVVEAMAIEASRQHGASMQVQRRDPNNDRKQVYDAGTDSDFITDAKSVQQAKNIKQSFNQRFSDYLQKHGLQVPANSEWTKINDIDFMVSPEGLSAKTFEDISAVNNDAYKRPDAARYEAKKRIGADISVKETIAYIDEMRDFVAKKQRKSAELSQKLRDLKKNKAAKQSGSAKYAERMRIETELQQVHAQQGKYFDRIGEANNRLATMNQTGEAVSNLSGQEKINAEIMEQAKVLASDLPGRGKVRAPDAEVSAKQRQIASATVNASEQHLMSQGKLSEAMLLAVLANRSPENAAALQKRIVEISKDLSPSQRGELIERLKNNPKVDNQLVRRINQGMQDTAKTSSIGSEPSSANKSKVRAPAGSLTKAGTGAGWVGDIMSINDQLKKAEEGQHLFINMDDQDSDAIKALKKAAIAIIELSPIPIIDSLERGWAADEKIKKQILEKIAKGETVNPALITAQVFAEVAGDTIASMTIQPLLSGGEAMGEGVDLTSTLFKNWQDQAIHAEALQQYDEKFDAFFSRMEKIDLGLIHGAAVTTNGDRLLVLDNVSFGAQLNFFMPRTPRWKNEYKVVWEVRTSGKKVKIIAIDRVSATNEQANQFSFINNLPPGNYEVLFRIFDKSNKQMDFASLDLGVSGTFGMGGIMVENFDGTSLAGAITVGDKLRFLVSPEGLWDKQHRIEWLLDGEQLKSAAANTPKITRLAIGFDDSFRAGSHQVAVRGINISTGKIVSHQNVEFILEGDTTKSEFKPFTLTLRKDDYQGAVVNTPLVFGDILAASAQVPLLGSVEQPVLSYLRWQLYNAAGQAVNGVSKTTQLNEAGGAQDARFKIKLTGLDNGQYKLVLVHQNAIDPNKHEEASQTFQISQPVRLTRLVVDDSPQGKKHHPTLYEHQFPHLFAEFRLEEGQDAADISLNVLTKSSGNKVYSKTINRLRKPKADGSQRVGMKLGKDIISKRGNYTFEAVITAADGTTDRKAIDFSISSYSLAIILPSHLTSGETGHFSIQLPNEFSKPFSVNIDMDSNLTISHGRGDLSGSLVGVAEKRDSKITLYATVTDSAGRVARGNGDLLVEAIPEPEPEPEPVYLPPPTYKPLLVQSSEPVSEPEPELEEDYAATYRNIMQDYNDKLAEIKRQEKANEAEYQAALGSSHTSSSSPSQRSGFRRCFQQTENRGYRATILLKGSGNWDDRVRTLSLKDCSNGTAFTEQLTVCGLNLYIDGYDVQEKKEMLFNNTFMALTLKNLIKRGGGGITHPNTEVCSVGVRPANW